MGAEVDLDPRGRGLEVGPEASTPAFPLEVLVPEAPKEETSRVEPETARSLFGMALGAEVAEAPVAVEQVEAPVEMAPAAPSTPRAAPFAVAEAEVGDPYVSCFVGMFWEGHSKHGRLLFSGVMF